MFLARVFVPFLPTTKNPHHPICVFCVQRSAVLSNRQTKMSKLSFRARALDPTKPMPIYLAEELPDLPEYSAINRAVPQMPSGMEKEEESVSFFCDKMIGHF